MGGWTSRTVSAVEVASCSSVPGNSLTNPAKCELGSRALAHSLILFGGGDFGRNRPVLLAKSYRPSVEFLFFVVGGLKGLNA